MFIVIIATLAASLVSPAADTPTITNTDVSFSAVSTVTIEEESITAYVG